MIVSVAFPITIDGVYDYKIPPEMESEIRRGLPVQVELRRRKLWGVVVEIKTKSEFPRLKSILATRGEQWSDSSESLITLYQWIASYYNCSIGKVFKPLIKKSIADAKAKEVVRFAPTGKKPDSLTIKQNEAIEKIVACGKPLTKVELKSHDIGDYMVQKLTKIGVLRKSVSTEVRESVESTHNDRFDAGALSETQQAAVETIWKAKDSPKKPFLIHGVTGSGKTYIFIELARRVIEEGKGVIILVPEIGLTPQTISRFSQALGEKIAVMHSRMSDGERRDSVEEVVSGKRRVVIGVRSSILIPMPNPGLIVVDEEHDGSYKQSDPEPRYNARDVAIMRGQFQKALVVLGSATPSMESYFNATSGKYELISLTERFGGATLPEVTVVDMNRERAKGNWSPFSAELKQSIEDTLADNKQIILLLNRRGYAVALVCGSCGHIRQCPHCSVNLVYHRTGDEIKCHHCGFTASPNYECEECGGSEIQYSGNGIQKVEDHLCELFPNSRILRMDQDTTSRNGSHISLLETFANRDADILLGTQMVAKGLSFPNVTLVGVLNADTGLAMPDFRASERLFQLLTQVAGRAGRNEHVGRVVLQTLSPQEPAVALSSKHDYNQFYNYEISDRADVGYPPFQRLARIIISSANEQLAGELAGAIARISRSVPDLSVLGPTEALFKKIKQEFRFSVLLKASQHTSIQSALSQIVQQIPYSTLKNCRYKIDVDPGSMA